MTDPIFKPRRPGAVALAVALGLSAYGCAHADSDERETLGVVSSVVLPPQANGKPPSWTGKAYRQGVVAVANPFGAEAGAKILEQGGNAVDAAVAIAYALNVVEPQSAGIGGGGFMLIHLASTGQTFAIDTRETAPADAKRDMFVGVPNASLQGVAVGVPGMVRGTEQAVKKYGRLSLAQVLQPAIELADSGFAATPRFVTSPNCSSATSRAKNSPLAAETFCPGGQAIPAGTLVTNKPLAETFRLIAQHGADCFYKMMPDKGCDIAQGIVEGQKFNREGRLTPTGPLVPGKGGSMTLADLEAYQPAIRAPISGTYRGYTIQSMAPPSSGALTVIQILKMLEQFPLGDASKGFGFGATNTLNVMADAMRLAFADRADWMADADFVPVPSKGLIDGGYLSIRDNALTPGVRLTPDPLPGDPRSFQTAGIEPAQAVARAAPQTGPENGTTHFSVVDQWGNVVSYTNTIESGYGIGVFAGYTRSDGTFRNHGFLLNNELTDFNIGTSTNRVTGEIGYNDVQPLKRPRSSMAPTMLFSPQGKPILAYGSPGGATIINSVVNITVNLIDHKMGLQQAVDAGRISVASAASTVTLENRLPSSAADALRALGYTVNPGDVGSVQAVLIDQQTGKQYGAADDRREGKVIGLPRGRGD
jgi:gamma-glutamyltranspeptidase / glutathione hydrolase